MTVNVLYFEGSRTFTVIDFDTIKKFVTSRPTCYDKQYVCVCVQLFSR